MPPDPRTEEYVQPWDTPSTIYLDVNNPEGDPNGDKFKAAARLFFGLESHQMIPLVLLHGRGPGIDVPKTLALAVYDNFPDKEKWL